MKKINILFYFIFSLFVLIFLFPKENIYYLLEEKLLSKNIIIDEKKINENLNSLEIKDGILYFQNNKIFSFSNILFETNIFKNRLSIKNLKMENIFKNYLKDEIKEINFENNFFNHKEINGFIYIDKKYDFLITIENDLVNILFFDKNILNSSIKKILKNTKTTEKGIVYELKYN